MEMFVQESVQLLYHFPVTGVGSEAVQEVQQLIDGLPVSLPHGTVSCMGFGAPDCSLIHRSSESFLQQEVIDPDAFRALFQPFHFALDRLSPIELSTHILDQTLKLHQIGLKFPFQRKCSCCRRMGGAKE